MNSSTSNILYCNKHIERLTLRKCTLYACVLSMSQVAVIGCGVIGLTSALAIQTRVKHVKVTIFTKDITPNTTSDIAAGYWQPYLVGNTPPKQINKWSKATYHYLLRLWKEGRANEAGICLELSRCFSEIEDSEIPDWKDIVLHFSNLSKEYLDKVGKLCNRSFVSGYEFISFTWEASVFLPFLEKEFLQNGGMIVRKEVKDFCELEGFDVIVNCAGLDAKNLTGDGELCPYRGQIARVSAPWQFHTLFIKSDHDRSCYIIPNKNCVIMGGTRQPLYNTEVDETDKANIFRNCSDLVPALATAEVIKHQVGLRPGRERVRLEAEIREGGKNGLLRIVHNYGHGGAGITLSIGCAVDCAELVERVINQTNLGSKL